jgi:hypothetical protein
MRKQAMAFGSDPRVMTQSTAQADIDAGLRAHMLKVYNYMVAALVITGVTAFATATVAANNPELKQVLYGSPLKWLIMFAPLALVFFLSARIHSMSLSAAQVTFWIYSGLMGLSLSSIFLIYTGESITQVFFITAATFAGMSLYGYTTKKDLSGIGSFLMMGLLGIIIASIVNIFLGSSALHFAISVIGVLIFTGLTAYDTQKIKEIYLESDGTAVAGKKAIMGALALYLDFINLFIMLLQLFGNRE